MTLSGTYLDTLRRKINHRLGEIYPQGPRLLTEPVHYALAGKGKRLRPILTLLTNQACGGKEADALHAAVAVELLHNFTLVHDDIMDQDHTRHGQTTVHTKWDDGVGVLAGDAMFIIALMELRLSSDNVEDLTKAFANGALAVCEGQALDKEFETRSRVTLDEYMQMIDLKTGLMLGLAAELGAICASAGQEQIEGVRRFGCLMGRAFQVQDDLLEIFSDARTMGKSLGSDLLADKKTYLMIAALDKVPDQVQATVETARIDLEPGLASMRRILEDNGIRQLAEETIHRNIAEAKSQLTSLGQNAATLEAFAELILNREK
ncbi:MAG: polyprenyl synthetase family protein [Fidelibacterota bacterium]|nr:MAG: polyprenyl synthetase family protein [Candidatus Neomarinimicrobiota bacterium]